MNNQKIFLTGYRATGKSCVGRLLADRLGLDFTDMDKEITAREGRAINEMVAAHGWPYFRDLEQRLLRELAASPDAGVVATGGGAILHQEVWPEVMRAATVVWLTADVATICSRLRGDGLTASQRPSLTGNDVCDEIATVLAEREPLYRRWCHFSLDTAAHGQQRIVELIVKRLGDP